MVSHPIWQGKYFCLLTVEEAAPPKENKHGKMMALPPAPQNFKGNLAGNCGSYKP